MSRVQIIGPSQSNYVRTTRMAAQEMGVDYDHAPAMPHSPEVKALHPLGKVPVMRHGEVQLCESRAIIAYLENALASRTLTPSDPAEAAVVEQWVAMLTTSMIQVFVQDYLFAYIFPGTDDGSPNRAQIEAAQPKLEEYLTILNDAAGKHEFIATDAFSIADAYLAPALSYLKDLPEAAALLAERPALAAYLARVEGRESFKAATAEPERA